MTTPQTQPPADMGEIVERLQMLLERATPRPWKASPYRGCIGSQVWAGEPGPDAVLICGDGDAEDVDAQLIAEAINALPALLTFIGGVPK